VFLNLYFLSVGITTVTEFQVVTSTLPPTIGNHLIWRISPVYFRIKLSFVGPFFLEEKSTGFGQAG
jgi:hypothetical protein